MQQPEPVGRRRGRGPGLQGGRHRGPEAGGPVAGRPRRPVPASRRAGPRCRRCCRCPPRRQVGGRVWALTAACSPGSQRAPSWATTTAVTTTGAAGSGVGAGVVGIGPNLREQEGAAGQAPGRAAGQRRALDRALLQPAPLALGEPAPDPEALVVGQRVLQALGPDVAAEADLLGLPGRAPLLREEGLRVGLGAQGPLGQSPSPSSSVPSMSGNTSPMACLLDPVTWPGSPPGGPPALDDTNDTGGITRASVLCRQAVR